MYWSERKFRTRYLTNLDCWKIRKYLEKLNRELMSEISISLHFFSIQAAKNLLNLKNLSRDLKCEVKTSRGIDKITLFFCGKCSFCVELWNKIVFQTIYTLPRQLQVRAILVLDKLNLKSRFLWQPFARRGSTVVAPWQTALRWAQTTITVSASPICMEKENNVSVSCQFKCFLGGHPISLKHY